MRPAHAKNADADERAVSQCHQRYQWSNWHGDPARAGERDPDRLSTLKHGRVRASRGEIARSLEGNWREELLIVLEQSLELYDLYVLKIAVCDQPIDRHLKTMKSKPEPGPSSDPAALPLTKQEQRFRPQGPPVPHHGSRHERRSRPCKCRPCRPPLPRSART